MLTNEYYSNLLQKLFKQWESNINPAKKPAKFPSSIMNDMSDGLRSLLVDLNIMV